MFSLERWMNSAETSNEIVLDYFRWSDEEIRREQVLKISDNFSLKWWRMPARTCFEIVLKCFRWSDEKLRLEQVLKLSDNIFVEVMKKSSQDVFWNCLTMFPLKRWGKSAETSIEIVLEYFRWSDEEIRLKQVLKLSDNIFVEVMKKSS